ncbi:MAG: hypothetical protein M3O70_04810 [Actinomycetota bacterium]|nr:hypothetical protein [Actinomycetota bacterium]
MSFTTAAVLVAWVAIALLAFVVSHLVRQVSLLSDRRGHRRPTTSTPMTPPEEVVRQVGDLGRRFTVALVVGESCVSCHRLLPRYLELVRDHVDRDASFSVAALGDGRGLLELTDGVAVSSHARHWAEPLGIRVTPYLLVIDQARNEASGRAVGSTDALEEAVTSALAVAELAG